MQKIAMRAWREAAPRLMVVEQADASAVLSIDAVPSFVDHPPPRVVHAQQDDPHGRLEISWQSDVAEGSVVAEPQPGLLRFCCDLRVTDDFSSAGVSWSFRLHLQHPRVLSGNYRMVSLRKTQRHAALTPMVMQARAGDQWLGVLATDALMGHDWRLEHQERVTGTIYFDQPLAHPRFTFEGPQFRNWHNRYHFPAGRVLRREFFVMIADQPLPLLVPGRYPRRCRAAFSITDHADHDTWERLAALWYGDSRARVEGRRSAEPAGFVGLRLPFTKSVFTATPQPAGPGLHDAAFADLCREGYAAGIEICPHGVHSTNQPAVSELEGLLAPFAEFKPLTWIDHGNRFLSNYGRRGWDPRDEYSLLPWLDRLGIQFVWGRLDFGQSLPHGQLDQVGIEQFCGWSYLRDLPRHAGRALAARRPWAVLHGLSSIAFQLIPEPTMRQYFLAQRKIQRVMKADLLAIPGAIWQSGKMAAALALPPGVTDLCQHVTGVREELSRTPIFYPEHHAVFRGADDRWLFNTLAVHDVVHAYSPPVVAQLLEDYGIHLSHTYLASVSHAHVSHAIEPVAGNHWRLTRGFDDNLRHLARLRDEGRLWVASLGEIGEYWRRRTRVRLRPVAPGRWQLSLPADAHSPEPMELQVVALDAAEVRLADGPSLDLVPLRDDLHFGAVHLRAGQTIELDCRR